MPYYVPVMLNLEGQKCMVIGGGKVAERKAAMLIEAGAQTIIISPEITAYLQKQRDEQKIHWVEREYLPGDLGGAFLAFAATDQHTVNSAVVAEGEMLGIPVNDVSEGSQGSFITPAAIRRGGLVIAVSTSGAGPRAALELCREIDDHIGDDYERYIEVLSSARSWIKANIPESEYRKRLFRKLAEADILTLIRAGTFPSQNGEEVVAWIEKQTEE